MRIAAARAIAVLALLAPFIFPWIYAAVLVALVVLRYPALALAVGIEMDALYYVHGAAALPLGVTWGFVAMCAALLARRLLKRYLYVT